MISAQEARKMTEDYTSKWTIWDTIQEKRIGRQIKSTLKNGGNRLSVYNIRDNVALKLQREKGYRIRICGCLGMTWDVIEW